MGTIFSRLGGVSFYSIPSNNKNEAFIAFVDKEASEVMTASAPITSISIRQNTDVTITKNLDKGFLIAAFGDSPVEITINGLSVYKLSCVDKTKGADSIQQFFNKHKISNGDDKRLLLSINTGGKSSYIETYTCALVGCDISSYDQTPEAGLYKYKLSLIGATKNGK